MEIENTYKEKFISIVFPTGTRKPLHGWGTKPYPSKEAWNDSYTELA